MEEKFSKRTANSDFRDHLFGKKISKGDVSGEIAESATVSEDSWLDKTSTITTDSVLKNGSYLGTNSILADNTIVSNSLVSNGSSIGNYSMVHDSRINSTIISGGSVDISDSIISGRTMIMNGHSRLDGLVVTPSKEMTTDFHIRGTVSATRLTVSGDVLISGKNIVLPDDMSLGSGAEVHDASEVSVLSVSVGQQEDLLFQSQIVHLTGHKSNKYGYAVSITHKGNTVSLPVNQLVSVLVPLYGVNGHNQRAIEGAQAFFTAMSQ